MDMTEWTTTKLYFICQNTPKLEYQNDMVLEYRNGKSVWKKIAVLEPVCRRLTYVSKNMIWAVASSFSINLTHILESWLWKLISFMHLNTLVTRSLPDDCHAMDLAEQFSCLANPDCFGLTGEGRVLSNAVYLHLASSLLVPKWTKNPLFPRVWFWHEAESVCC